MPKSTNQANTMELVLFALLRCGGDHSFVSTDTVALEAFKLYPGKFCWEEYPHLPHWDRVRQWLSEAKKPKHGTLVEGYSGQRWEGWRLTAAGVRLLRFRQEALSQVEAMPVAEEDYVSARDSELVAVALFELSAAGRPADFPAVVARCYARFPTRFELGSHCGWPDACRVRDGLQEAIELKLVIDEPTPDRHELTAEGRSSATRTLGEMARPIALVSLAQIGKGLASRAGRQIADLMRTRAWESYGAGQPLTKAAACEAVQCTLESHPNAIVRALEAHYLAAEALGRQDVIDFLRLSAETIGVKIRGQSAAPHGGDQDGT